MNQPNREHSIAVRHIQNNIVWLSALFGIDVRLVQLIFRDVHKSDCNQLIGELHFELHDIGIRVGADACVYVFLIELTEIEGWSNRYTPLELDSIFSFDVNF